MSFFTDGLKAVDLTIYQDEISNETARPIDITLDYIKDDLSKKVFDENGEEAFVVESVEALIDWIKEQIAEDNAEAENIEYSLSFIEIDFVPVLDEDEPEEKVIADYQFLKKQTARLKKNAYQRAYAKRSGYAAANKSTKKNAKQFLIKFAKSTDAAIIEKLESVPNRNDYIRQLILNDINK